MPKQAFYKIGSEVLHCFGMINKHRMETHALNMADKNTQNSDINQ